jgi:hypothetical protein
MREKEQKSSPRQEQQDRGRDANAPTTRWGPAPPRRRHLPILDRPAALVSGPLGEKGRREGCSTHESLWEAAKLSEGSASTKVQVGKRPIHVDCLSIPLHCCRVVCTALTAGESTPPCGHNEAGNGG